MANESPVNQVLERRTLELAGATGPSSETSNDQGPARIPIQTSRSQSTYCHVRFVFAIEAYATHRRPKHERP